MGRKFKKLSNKNGEMQALMVKLGHFIKSVYCDYKVWLGSKHINNGASLLTKASGWEKPLHPLFIAIVELPLWGPARFLFVLSFVQHLYEATGQGCLEWECLRQAPC